MLYVCKFRVNVAIGSENRLQTKLFKELYDHGDLEKLGQCH